MESMNFEIVDHDDSTPKVKVSMFVDEDGEATIALNGSNPFYIDDDGKLYWHCCYTNAREMKALGFKLDDAGRIKGGN